MFFSIFHKFLIIFLKFLIISNAFYIVLSPSIHSDFFCICFPIKVLWGMDKVPIFLCCWHVFKAWFICGTKIIKDVKVQGVVLQDLHDVMYMSINHGETIDDFKKCGSVAMIKNLHKHKPSDVWTNYFWTYYHQFGK
jgi:hypothetical protein